MEETVSSKAYDRRLFRHLLSLLRPHWPAVLVAVVFLLLNSLVQVATPLLTKVAVDQYLDPSHIAPPAWLAPYLPADKLQGLVFIAMLYMAALALGFIFDFSQQFLMLRTGQLAMLDLRRRIMIHLQGLDLAFFDKTPVGRIVTRVTTDVDALNDLLSSGLVTVLGDVVVLTLILLTLFQLSPTLTLALLAVIPFVVFVTVKFRRIVQASNRRIRVAVARINSFLQEHVTGMSVLQLFNHEERSARDFEKVNRDHMEAYKDAIDAYGWFYPAIEFLSMLSLAALLAWGGWQVRNNLLTLGVLVAFFQYAMRVFRPIQDLSEKYNILQGALAASERIFELLAEKPRIAAPAQPRSYPEGPAAIEFDNVSFAYKDDDWVIRDLSFRIEPGETIAIVGHTGAGKTTLISLLLRFYDPQKGFIRVGGVNIRDMEPKEVRRHFGVVLQDPHMFTGTIGTNIRLGTTHLGDTDLESAATQVNLMDFVRSLPGGFDTPVRERGSGLSTGQKQLISFARALAHEPRYLILDEATSSVDTETEFRVREALSRMIAGRTSIIIAHRLSTIQSADRIFVMHKGTLREQGSHQQLLAQRGVYWHLYRLQYQEQESKALD